MPGKMRLRKQLDDYLNDRLPADRLDEMIKEILDETNTRFVEEVVLRTIRESGSSNLAGKGLLDEKFRRLMEAVRTRNIAETGQDEVPRVIRRRIIPLRTMSAAAAVVIIVMAIGGLWIARVAGPHTDRNNFAIDNAMDLEPGGERALLTLDDGSTVVLDTAREGILASQANTNIIKLADGQIGYAQSGKETSKILYNTISTPRGGEYNIILPDSSRVWLNAESSIRFPVSFTGLERKVEITGEVYFEVARDIHKPFRVSTGNVTVEVLGTSFNIRAYSDENAVTTTLLEGSVEIASALTSMSLVPGQLARADESGMIAIEDGVDVDEIIAWKNGIFLFNSENIEEIMRQIGRWYDVEVVFEGEITRETFSGIVSRKGKVSQVLQLMEPYGIKFTVTEDMITVGSK